MWHIGFSHLYFRSRREEWGITVWRDVKYVRPVKVKRNTYVPYKVETNGQRQDNILN